MTAEYERPPDVGMIDGPPIARDYEKQARELWALLRYGHGNALSIKKAATYLAQRDQEHARPISRERKNAAHFVLVEQEDCVAVTREGFSVKQVASQLIEAINGISDWKEERRKILAAGEAAIDVLGGEIPLVNAAWTMRKRAESAESRLSELLQAAKEHVEKVSGMADRFICSFCAGGLKEDEDGFPNENNEYEHTDKCTWAKLRAVVEKIEQEQAGKKSGK